MRIRRLTAAAACLAVGGWLSVVLAQTVFASLGLQEATAQRDVVHAFISGQVNVFPAAKAFKAGARAALVKGVFDWARAYTESAAYKAQYERERTANAPKPPAAKTADGELARQNTEQQKSIDEMKKNLAQTPPDLRKQMEATIKQIERGVRGQAGRVEALLSRRQGGHGSGPGGGPGVARGARSVVAALRGHPAAASLGRFAAPSVAVGDDRHWRPCVAALESS